MSSATPYDPQGRRDLLGAPAGPTYGPPPAMGMSPRQQRLEELWKYFKTTTYETHSVAWDGTRVASPTENDVIGHSGQLPEGFEDPGRSDFPLRFRKPDAPYHLVRVVVRRFTSLLFSARRHPQLRSPDGATQDAIREVAKLGRLWAQMILARNLGGAMGSVAIGFVVVRGRPAFEVHDPRWCTPTFKSRHDVTLFSIEKRYPYARSIRDEETGTWVEGWFWYRRVINEETDTVWEDVPVVDGEEPAWNSLPTRSVAHGMGECPVRWITNTAVLDEVDGEPDCQGTYPTIGVIDRLTSQACAGTIANCDPTLVLSTKREFDSLKKGSENAIGLDPGESAAYLEMKGDGPRIALDVSERLEERVSEQTRCVLEASRASKTQGGRRTATEAEQDYASMWEASDELREQYGEHGVKPLLEMVLRVCRRLETPRATAGGVVRGRIVLPPRAEAQPDGSVRYFERSFGSAETVELHWPQYQQPTVDTVLKAATAAKTAYEAELIDGEEGSEYLGPYFQVENVSLMRAKIDARAQQKEAAILAEARRSMLPGEE